MQASDTASPSTELGQMRSDGRTGAASFVGSGSGVAFVRTVRTALAKNINWSESHPEEQEMIPGEDDRAQHVSSEALWRDNEVHMANNHLTTPTVTFDDLVRWSEPYFTIWHPPFPFLHAPSILQLLERVSSNGLSTLNSNETTIVRSVLSIAVVDRRQMQPDKLGLVPSDLLFRTVEHAVSCLLPTLLRCSTLLGLQAAISVHLFLLSMLRLNSASRSMGLIVQAAFQLGLHRCPARYKQFDTVQKDMRRRLFWSIYSLERFLSQSLGLPIVLNDDDIDVCYPDHEVHFADIHDGPNIQQPQGEPFLLSQQVKERAAHSYRSTFIYAPGVSGTL
jgi:hypothetical protein